LAAIARQSSRAVSGGKSLVKVEAGATPGRPGKIVASTDGSCNGFEAWACLVH
jgi:hypothetical protein